MQKNHKQWMCMFLAIMLCLSFLLPCVAESDAEQWDNSGAREYYLGILEDLEVFQSDEHLYYWRTVNSIEKDEFLAFAIDVGAKVIEKYPTKEDYGRVLSYVLTMQQINIAANISEQSAFDDFRNTGDYVLDVTDIALSLLGIPETTSAISPVAGAFSFGKDTFSATSDSLTYYEMAITDYICSDLFLKALIDNTDDEMLKAVAHTFLNENVSLLNKKLEIIGDCGESAAGNLGNYYIENIFFKTLQALDGTDMESVRWLGEAGEGFYNAVISTPKLAFDITMLAGNSLFGTSDQYKTYQEMTILAEVARSLSCEIQKTDVKNAKGQELEYALNKNYYLYKALITTGCRGEYLFFHLLDDHSGTNRGIVEFFTGKKLLSTDQIDELQEKQFRSIAYYYNVLVKSYQNQRRSICVSHCWENDRCTICGREKLRSEDTFVTGKRLTQADVCFKSGNSWQVQLNYDENGLLTGYTRDSYSSDHEYHYSYAYTYNADGNLTQSREILSGYPCTKYYYNDEGKLTSWEYREFPNSYGDVYNCEYNSLGQRIRDISTDGKNETLYSYDDLGRLTFTSSRWVYGDMSGTNETTMVYDEYGNLTKKEILSDSGFFSPSVETYVYNYDHFPFVHAAVYTDGELSYSRIDYTAMPADEVLSFTIDNTAKFEGEDGYLVKVIGEDGEWNFSYMQESSPTILDIPDSENQSGEANASLRQTLPTKPSESHIAESQNQSTDSDQRIEGFVVNADSGLNVRQDPSTAAEIVRRIHNGEQVTITEQITIDGMPWGRISDGWICMNYVKLEDEGNSQGVRYIVSPSAGLVNVRCGAGTSYESIERISGGEEVIIYEQKTVGGRDWGKTDTGWICMDYLTRSP